MSTLPASRLAASENKAEGTWEASTFRSKERTWWTRGAGQGRWLRDQANPKDCNPFPGQGKARQGLPETLGQPQSLPWRKWYLDWQGTVRQIRSGPGVSQPYRVWSS